MDLTVTLTDAQLEAIAVRLAELLADRPSAPAPELLTVAQAAELAGVSAKTVRNWLSAGRLARHGKPHAPRVARAELLALIDPQAVLDGRTDPGCAVRPGGGEDRDFLAQRVGVGADALDSGCPVS